MQKVYSYKKVTDTIMYVYLINISDGHANGGWYRQLTSIYAFSENILNRWYNKFLNTGITIFGRCDEMDVDVWTRINKYLDEQEKYTVEYKSFDSVWDFYNYIGYDYKNKSKKQLDNLIINWRD